MTRKSAILPILITPGEPLGIGLDIVIQALPVLEKINYPYKIIANIKLLQERADQLGLVSNIKHLKNNIINNNYVLDCLDTAIKLCRQKKAAALLTGPVNKKMINQSGVKFSGHTQYLAQKTHTKNTVMFFENPHLKLALVTDHIPLCQVSRKITQKRLLFVFNILSDYLKKYFKLLSPKIAVCGLNPHAGEGGYLGQEENKIIIPAIQTAQKKLKNLSGPFSADALFHEKNLKKYDAVIAMYHDQGLSVLKHRYFGKSVNITLGLPFLRTSVDHGTACELAGTGKSDPGNLIYVFSRTVELIHAQTP